MYYYIKKFTLNTDLQYNLNDKYIRVFKKKKNLKIVVEIHIELKKDHLEISITIINYNYC